MSACNARVKRERSANLRQDRCCEVESRAICHWPMAGKTARNVEAESEDLPDKYVSDSSD